MGMYEARQRKEKVSRRIENSKTKNNSYKRKSDNFRYGNVCQNYSYDCNKITQFTNEHGHSFLFNNINSQMSELEVVAQLLENFFNRSDFNYNYSSKGAWGHEGDCSTLCNEFNIICMEVFNIQNIQIFRANGGFLTLSPQKIIHKQNVTGNMDQGRRWYFESHTWIVWNGMPIDVLFGQFGVVSHQTNIRTVYEDNDDFFYQAGNVHFYLKNVSLFDRYTTKEEDRFRYNQ